jgi:FSR family fosmidomycin resistance protein-like MFS transporter
VTLLAIELLDELVFGAREAAWPSVRDDLSLSYTEIGLALSVPSLVSLVVEPLLGVAAVTWRRRTLVLGGGVAFAAGLALLAGAPSFALLLSAFVVLYPASGAFVALSQASLMDLEPERRDHNMARWTFAGALGAVAGPFLVAGFIWAGLGWRPLFVAFAVLAVVLLLLVGRAPAGELDDERPRVRDALRALASRDVFRWVLLLEVSDLLLDVFLGFLALYFVDVERTADAVGGLAVGIWTTAFLVGSALAIPFLRRFDGLRYLRVSALVSAALFVAFLTLPSPDVKLALVAALGVVNAGWYPVLKARLYDALQGKSGLVLTVGALFPLNAVLPLAVAGLAERYGLDVALWPLLAAPIALLLLVPRRREPGT